MATLQTSRSATDPRKHYSGVFFQMGRVVYEDDLNESQDIQSEERRRSRVDIIGPHGSPDDGFLISAPVITGAELDFGITHGSLYVGGNRLDLEADERYVSQRDWLEQAPSDRVAPTAERIDFVFVECWAQHVGSVEDRETLEVALGGVDTAMRMREMRRVRLFSDVQTEDCGDAWQKLLASWNAAGLGTLNDQYELTTDATLVVTPMPGGPTTDLCRPSVAGGYLGAENQTIRVELLDAGHFTWGFDNASAMHRVTVAGAVVTLHTHPKDETLWPIAGQVVEILPWSAVLENGEKVAETAGFLARVQSSYSPDTHELTLSVPLPAGFGTEWTARADAASLGTPFFYMRVWDRGSDLTSAPALAFTPGVAVSLPHTGLDVTISGAHRRAGDHWIIAARPDTPDEVVPWSLKTGRAPHGVRRFYAPLGLIRWSLDASGTLVGKVIDDCRGRITPITRIPRCCRYTVGDGIKSHGHFKSIQTAIDHLPVAGGEICVLPGTYREQVSIVGRKNVTISGCGKQSRLRMPAAANGGPLVHIAASQEIRIHGLDLENAIGHGIVIDDGLVKKGRELVIGSHVEDLELTDLHIRVTRWAAIAGNRTRRITIARNHVSLLADGGILSEITDDPGWPAIFIGGEDMLVEENEIAFPRRASKFSGFGGLQIAGRSRHVQIRRNTITGGHGHGITLGSISYKVLAPATGGLTLFTPLLARPYSPWWKRVIWLDECLTIVPDPPGPPDDDGNPTFPFSDGPLSDVHIIDNLIEACGGSGITVAHFFSDTVQKLFGIIHVSGLYVRQNVIRECLSIDQGDLGDAALYRACGGITLASIATGVFESNLIHENGSRAGDSVCGLFVALGRGLGITANQIRNNGTAPTANRPMRSGRRGGIVCTSYAPASPPRRAAAAIIADNVVTCPWGPALVLLARGRVAVHGNTLSATGVTYPRGDLLESIVTGAFALDFAAGGSAVWIADVGASRDAPWKGILPSSPGATVPMPTSTIGPNAGLTRAPFLALLDTYDGNVLFNDNQVTLDAPDATARPIWSATLIFSLDDVAVQSNQLSCWVPAKATQFRSDLTVTSVSARVEGNRLEEAAGKPRYSGIITAGMNATTGNQSTRCLFISGHPSFTIDEPNRSWVGAACDATLKQGRDLGVKLFQRG